MPAFHASFALTDDSSTLVKLSAMGSRVQFHLPIGTFFSWKPCMQVH